MIWEWRSFHNYDAAQMSHPEQKAGDGEQTSLSRAGFFCSFPPGISCWFLLVLKAQLAVFFNWLLHYFQPADVTFVIVHWNEMAFDFNVIKVIDTFSWFPNQVLALPSFSYLLFTFSYLLFIISFYFSLYLSSKYLQYLQVSIKFLSFH